MSSNVQFTEGSSDDAELTMQYANVNFSDNNANIRFTGILGKDGKF